MTVVNRMYDLYITKILSTMGALFGVTLTATNVVHPISLSLKRSPAVELFKPYFDKTHVIVILLSIK